MHLSKIPPAITTMAANSEVEVKGMYEGFIRVKYKDLEGWLDLEK